MRQKIFNFCRKASRTLLQCRWKTSIVTFCHQHCPAAKKQCSWFCSLLTVSHWDTIKVTLLINVFFICELYSFNLFSVKNCSPVSSNLPLHRHSDNKSCRLEKIGVPATSVSDSIRHSRLKSAHVSGLSGELVFWLIAFCPVVISRNDLCGHNWTFHILIIWFRDLLNAAVLIMRCCVVSLQLTMQQALRRLMVTLVFLQITSYRTFAGK